MGALRVLLLFSRDSLEALSTMNADKCIHVISIDPKISKIFQNGGIQRRSACSEPATNYKIAIV